MHASDYQNLSARTLIDSRDVSWSPDEAMLAGLALGLAGEAGEVVELVKKGVFHRHGLDKAGFEKELGDVLWYVAALCTRLGLDMAAVMEKNIEKLRQRYPDGFSTAGSLRRADAASGL